MNKDYTARYTLDTTYDLIAKAGYQIKPTTTLYGLAGATHTSLNDTIVFTSSAQLGALDLAAFSQNKDLWGAIVGAGLEQAVTEHCHLALEYNHTFYHNINYSLQPAIFKFLGNVGNNQLDLNENTVMLKAIYYL
jgi:opacity protein-like surface antigen